MVSAFYDRDGALSPETGLRQRTDFLHYPVNIDNGTPYSAEVLDLRREVLVGLRYPSAWTAAGIAFEH